MKAYLLKDKKSGHYFYVDSEEDGDITLLSLCPSKKREVLFITPHERIAKHLSGHDYFDEDDVIITIPDFKKFDIEFVEVNLEI